MPPRLRPRRLEGILRARFRQGYERPVLLTPGEPALLRVELRAVSNLFRAGHRLRVDIHRQRWPHFDVNTHTGRNPSADTERRRAQVSVHHSEAHPSRLLLPIRAPR